MNKDIMNVHKSSPTDVHNSLWMFTKCLIGIWVTLINFDEPRYHECSQKFTKVHQLMFTIVHECSWTFMNKMSHLRLSNFDELWWTKISWMFTKVHQLMFTIIHECSWTFKNKMSPKLCRGSCHPCLPGELYHTGLWASASRPAS